MPGSPVRLFSRLLMVPPSGSESKTEHQSIGRRIVPQPLENAEHLSFVHCGIFGNFAVPGLRTSHGCALDA